jgi:hypothetical protein
MINSPLGREIFINGNYAASAGVSPGPFGVGFGPNTFEALDGRRRVDHRGTAAPNAFYDQHDYLPLASSIPPNATDMRGKVARLIAHPFRGERSPWP